MQKLLYPLRGKWTVMAFVIVIRLTKISLKPHSARQRCDPFTL